jgi:hypothetical protein
VSEHQELSEPYVGMVSCRVLLLAVGLLFFVALVDPADTIFHLKEPVFVSVILIWVLRRGLMRRTLTKLIWIVTFTLVFVIPLIWTMIGLLNNGLHSADAQFGLLKCFLFLLLLPVAISEDIDLVALLIRISILIALLTIAMCVISYLLPSLFVALYAISLDKQNAMIAPSRDVVGIGLGMFYYKTSALMIFPFTYYFSRLLRRKIRWWLSFLLCLLFGAALFISGTRANALAVVLVVGILMLNRIRLAGGWIAALMIGVMGVILLAVTIIPKFADTQEHGNAIKLGHFRSYEHEFSEKPSVLLWGEGAGSAFYSEGISARLWIADDGRIWCRITMDCLRAVVQCCPVWCVGVFGVFGNSRFRSIASKFNRHDSDVCSVEASIKT